jgi:hypothetical protein
MVIALQETCMLLAFDHSHEAGREFFRRCGFRKI